MHELSIAINILDIAEQAAGESGETKVAAIHLKLGPLSGVVSEALMSAFELARQSTPFADCELKIEKTRLIGFCPVCRVQREIPSVQYLCCPICDTPTPDIVSGRELDIIGMEVIA